MTELQLIINFETNTFGNNNNVIITKYNVFNSYIPIFSQLCFLYSTCVVALSLADILSPKCHVYLFIIHLFVTSVVRRRTTDEYRRCVRKFWTLYIFYWIKVILKLPFAVSFSDLFISIKKAAFH